MHQTIHYHVEHDDAAGGVAILSLDLPGQSVNVLTPELMADLGECVERAVADPAVRGLVLTSAKRLFIAGADIKDMVTAWDRGMSAPEAYAFSKQLNDQLRRMETCGKPVVAAINGTALGGGLEVCLACHYRVLAEDANAVLGLPEVTIGLIPGAGGTQRLPRLVGMQAALPLMLEGRNIKPAQVLQLGIVDELAPATEVVARACAWIRNGGNATARWDQKGFQLPGGAGATTPANAQAWMAGAALTAGKAQDNYPAPRALLSAVYEGCLLPIDKGLEIESQYFAQLLAGPVARNMMRTLFVNKGAADKLAARPSAAPPFTVQRLGVLGAGLMGAGIAYVAARAGIEVVLLDQSREQAERGKAYGEKLLTAETEKGRLAAGQAPVILGRIKPVTDYAELSACQLVIEAVFEDSAVKAEVTRKAQAVLARDAFFASNTSTLPIDQLANAAQQPERFLGLHFFSPVEKMPLVEVIRGARSSDAAIAAGLDFVKQLRKTPIVVRDSRGFYTSRVFSTSTNEGMALLAEGVAPALIENAAKMAGFPVGPLAVSDEVSLSLALQIASQTAAAIGQGFPYTACLPVLELMVSKLDRKGRRAGAGFYEYPADGPKHLWPGLATHFPLAAEQPSVAEIQQRLLAVQALETVRCLDEGVLLTPADADVGAVFGWGFPAWAGGPLSYIETFGLPEFVSLCERLTTQHGPRFLVPESLRERAAAGRKIYTI